MVNYKSKYLSFLKSEVDRASNSQREELINSINIHLDCLLDDDEIVSSILYDLIHKHGDFYIHEKDGKPVIFYKGNPI